MSARAPAVSTPVAPATNHEEVEVVLCSGPALDIRRFEQLKKPGPEMLCIRSEYIGNAFLFAPEMPKKLASLPAERMRKSPCRCHRSYL